MPAGQLSRLFDPRSIAVVGASANEAKPGFQILRALEPFHGAVHAVNPRGGTVMGRPVHRSLADIPEPVDLVALVLPARHSLAVLEEAAAIGAGAAFMVSGGFGETGAAGAALEADIARACRSGFSGRTPRDSCALRAGLPALSCRRRRSSGPVRSESSRNRAGSTSRLR